MANREHPNARMAGWPFNRNHEAARRHVNQILRNHGRPDYSRRETEIAQLLDELIRERDELRSIVYSKRRASPERAR
jgi:hypothetical protein